MRSPEKLALALIVVAGCATAPDGVQDLDRLQEICAGPVPERPRLEVLDLSPAAGKPVDRQGALRARLSYSIPPTFAGDCILAAQWISRKGGSFMSSSKDHTARPILARGVETITVPLSFPFANPELARPVQVRFVIQNLKGGSIIAASDLFSFGPGQTTAPTLTVRSLDPAPDEALAPGTVVKALLAYRVPEFVTGGYEILTLVGGVKPGTTRMPAALRARAAVTAPTGLAVLTLPLAELLKLPATRRPLEISFGLARREGDALWVMTETPIASYDLCKVIGTPPPREH